MANGCLLVKQKNAATYGIRLNGICSVDKNGDRFESKTGLAGANFKKKMVDSTPYIQQWFLNPA